MIGVGGSIDDNWSWDATASIGRADADRDAFGLAVGADHEDPAALGATTALHFGEARADLLEDRLLVVGEDTGDLFFQRLAREAEALAP